MQIHGQDPVGTGRRDEIRNKLRRDRHTRLILSVLPSISEIGYDGRDAIGRGAFQGIDHDEQLHEGVVDRAAGGLHDVDIRTAHVFFNLDADFSVAERRNRRLAELCAEIGADLMSEGEIRIARENHQFSAHRSLD